MAPAAPHDLKEGWVVRMYRDGCEVHLGWESPPSYPWGKSWWFDLAKFAADVEAGGGTAKGCPEKFGAALKKPSVTKPNKKHTKENEK